MTSKDCDKRIAIVIGFCGNFKRKEIADAIVLFFVQFADKLFALGDFSFRTGYDEFVPVSRETRASRIR